MGNGVVYIFVAFSMYVIILKGLASAKLINSSIGNTMIRTLERIRRRRRLGTWAGASIQL